MIMSFMQDFNDTRKRISAALVAITRNASRISAEDVEFHSSSNPTIGQSINDRNARLLLLAEKLILKSSGPTTVSRPRLRDCEGLDTNWEMIVDGIDSLLERADTALDEFAGYVKKRRDDSRESSPFSRRPKYLPKEFRNPNIAKPQLLFPDPPYNNEKKPFCPILKAKPHAVVDLSSCLTSPEGEAHPHPYEYEIQHYQYPPSVYEVAVPIQPEPFDSTRAIFVDSIAALASMIEELKIAKEIAVDLEHHDTHSYVGLVSLMQISTRHRDFIVDTLKPWRRELEALNVIFADPRIVKVLHGAQMDVIWLQRDLGLYLVGLFDTYHASRALGYTGHSLAFLLKRFVDFDAQKQYQTADWRIRPLPAELFDYARSDTHFLLYIYDRMRNELIEKSTDHKGGKVAEVLFHSKEYALQRYEHPFYCQSPTRSSNGWFSQLLKVPANLTNVQLVAFRKLHEWRDLVARQEDESTNYIMSNYTLQGLARSLPKDPPSLFALLGNTTSFVRGRAPEILALISEASTQEDDGAEIQRALQSVPSYGTWSSLPSPHVELADVRRPHTDVIRAAQSPLSRITSSSFWGPTLAATDHSSESLLPDLFDLAFIEKRSGGAVLDKLGHAEVVDSGKKRKLREGLETTVDKKIHVIDKAGTSIQYSIPNDVGSTHTLPKLHQTAKSQKKNIESTVGEQQPAFDYVAAAAASALIQNEPARSSRHNSKNKKEAFNPYKKAAEADGGLGRAQNMRSGRTSTFK